MVRFGFDNSYRRLPERFFAPLAPAAVSAPRLIAFNRPLAHELGLDVAAIEPQAAALFSGNALAEDAEPIALAYAGHQFGQLRAAARRRPRDPARRGRRPHGQRRDIQLKGSGPHAVLARAATAARRSGRCCASTSSARRCTRSASRPRARWRW